MSGGEFHDEWCPLNGCRCGNCGPCAQMPECPASPPAVAASTGTSEGVEALGNVAYEHFDEAETHMGRCYLEADVLALLAAREAAARAEGAAAVRDDIRARRREFRRLNADREYLNALDDAYGLAANRAREGR